MFKVKVDNVEYKISFHHFVKSPEDRKHRRQCTECKIEYIDSSVDTLVIKTGLAVCNPCDIYQKDMGRKISLAKALRSFPRDFRKLLWLAYFCAYD